MSHGLLSDTKLLRRITAGVHSARSAPQISPRVASVLAAAIIGGIMFWPDRAAASIDSEAEMSATAAEASGELA